METVLDTMDTMVRERLKLKPYLNQDTAIMVTVMVMETVMDSMARERLKLILLQSQDTAIVVTVMVMDMMAMVMDTTINCLCCVGSSVQMN